MTVLAIIDVLSFVIILGLYIGAKRDLKAYQKSFDVAYAEHNAATARGDRYYRQYSEMVGKVQDLQLANDQLSALLAAEHAARKVESLNAHH